MNKQVFISYVIALVAIVLPRWGSAAPVELDNPSGEVEFETLNARDQNPADEANFPWIRPNDTPLTQDPTCANKCPAGMLCPGMDTNEGAEDNWTTCVDQVASSSVWTSSTDEKLAEVFYDSTGAIVRIEIYPEASAKPNEADEDVKGTIAWAENQLTAGAQLYLHPGTYTISGGTPITFNLAGTSLICANPTSTVITAASGHNADLIQLGFTGSQLQGLTVRNCGFNGNRANNTGGAIIHARDTARAWIEGNHVQFYKAAGVLLDATTTGMVENRIERNVIFDGDGEAVLIESAGASPTDTFLVGNVMSGGSATATTDAVMQGTAIQGLIMHGNHVYRGTGNGHTSCVVLSHSGATDLSIVGNVLENCREHGLAGTGFTSSVIADTKCYTVGRATDSTYDCLNLTSVNSTTITNTHARSATSTGTNAGVIRDVVNITTGNNNQIGITTGQEIDGYAVRINSGGTNVITSAYAHGGTITPDGHFTVLGSDALAGYRQLVSSSPSVVTAGQTLFMPVGASDISGTATTMHAPMRAASQCRHLQCYVSAAPGTSESVAFTVQRGACGTALSDSTVVATISNSALTATSSNSVSVGANECLVLEVAYSGSAATSVPRCILECL